MSQALQTVSTDNFETISFIHVCCTFPVLYISNIDLILLKQARFLPLSWKEHGLLSRTAVGNQAQFKHYRFLSGPVLIYM